MCWFLIVLFNYECTKKVPSSAQLRKKRKEKDEKKQQIISKNQKSISNNNISNNLIENKLIIIDEETVICSNTTNIINENVFNENQTGTEKLAIDISSNTTSVETISNKNQTINWNDSAEWKSENYH